MSDIVEQMREQTVITEIARLRAENEKLRVEIETLKEIAVRETMKVATLRAALKFYADDDNWRLNGPLDANSVNFTGGPAATGMCGDIESIGDD